MLVGFTGRTMGVRVLLLGGEGVLPWRAAVLWASVSWWGEAWAGRGADSYFQNVGLKRMDAADTAGWGVVSVRFVGGCAQGTLLTPQAGLAEVYVAGQAGHLERVEI